MPDVTEVQVKKRVELVKEGAEQVKVVSELGTGEGVLSATLDQVNGSAGLVQWA